MFNIYIYVHIYKIYTYHPQFQRSCLLKKRYET